MHPAKKEYVADSIASFIEILLYHYNFLKLKSSILKQIVLYTGLLS